LILPMDGFVGFRFSNKPLIPQCPCIKGTPGYRDLKSPCPNARPNRGFPGLFSRCAVIGYWPIANSHWSIPLNHINKIKSRDRIYFHQKILGRCICHFALTKLLRDWCIGKSVRHKPAQKGEEHGDSRATEHFTLFSPGNIA